MPRAQLTALTGHLSPARRRVSQAFLESNIAVIYVYVCVYIVCYIYKRRRSQGGVCVTHNGNAGAGPGSSCGGTANCAQCRVGKAGSAHSTSQHYVSVIPASGPVRYTLHIDGVAYTEGGDTTLPVSHTVYINDVS